MTSTARILSGSLALLLVLSGHVQAQEAGDDAGPRHVTLTEEQFWLLQNTHSALVAAARTVLGERGGATERLEGVMLALSNRAEVGVGYVPPGQPVPGSKSVPDAVAARPKVWVTGGLLEEVEARAAGLPAAEREGFVQRVVGLVLAQEVARAAGVAERDLPRQALEIFNHSTLAGAQALTPAGGRDLIRRFLEPGGERLAALGERLQGFLSRPEPEARPLPPRDTVTETLARVTFLRLQYAASEVFERDGERRGMVPAAYQRAANGELRLRIDADPRPLAPGFYDGVVLSTGLLERIPDTPDGRLALEMILAEQLARACGAGRIEEASSIGRDVLAAYGVRPSPAQFRRALAVLGSTPTGFSSLDKLIVHLERLAAPRSPDGLPGGPALATGLLQRYRRADGTLRWAALGRDGALREGGALAHFGLALFLKELTVVAATGDRRRIEEFFDGLMSTDFYRQYGAFAVGARAADVAYGRYLQGYVKPRFVNGILKTQVTLAAGMALADLLEGDFDGRTFAISLSSLGLSSAAVQAGLRAVPGVRALSTASRAGGAVRLGRMARLGGWLFTAGELALVLLVAEPIQSAVTAALDLRQARGALADAGQALYEARGEDAAPAALQAYRQAWEDFRLFLMAPLLAEEQRLGGQLEGLARKAKLVGDERAALLEHLPEALRAQARERFGSLDGYADRLAAAPRQELQAEVDAALAAYNQARAALLRARYEEGRQAQPFFTREQESLVVSGQGADAFAGAHRQRASLNRLQTYEQEAAALRLLEAQRRARGAADEVASLAQARQRVLALRDADARLWGREGSDAQAADGPGLAGALQEAPR